MDPDPLRLLETAHPLRSGSISQGSPKPRFAIRPNCRLKRPSKLVNKTVNNFIKFVDGPTQMSRRRPRGRLVAEDRSELRGWKKVGSSRRESRLYQRETAEDDDEHE